jgi:hypothetical protein
MPSNTRHGARWAVWAAGAVILGTIGGVAAVHAHASSAKKASPEAVEGAADSSGAFDGRESAVLARLEVASARLENATARIDNLEREVAALKTGQGPGVRAPAGAGARPPPTPRPSPAELDDESRRRAERLSDYFDAEPRDAKWAADYEGQIASLAKKGNGVDLTNVSCRTSVCRIEVTNTNEATRIAFLNEVQMSLAGASAVYHGPETAGSNGISSVVHVFRAGYPMPDIM